MNSRDRLQHILERFSFGPSVGQLDQLTKDSISAEAWFEHQLSNQTLSDSLKNKLAALKSLTYTNAQMLSYFPKPKKKNELAKNTPPPTTMMTMEGMTEKPQEILKELSLQKLIRAVHNDNQLEEVLVDFWFNHFNVSFDKGQVRYAITSYERDVIRPHVFGKFEDLLMATAKSPAMLFYLDNHKSHKDEINENYARELMELHTLGVDGGYTQKDVQEAARVLTGWGLEQPQEILEFKFKPRQHDEGSKQVLNFKIAHNEGIHEGEKLLRYLAAHKSTAHFIAKKLAVKFINDEPKTKTIEKLAQVYLQTQGDLKSLYRAILTTNEFWQSAGQKIKMPFEYIASAARILGVDILPDTDRINKIRNFFDQSGESLYKCQPPTGYSFKSDYWVTASALVNRLNFALQLTKDQIPQMDFDKKMLLKPIQSKKYSQQIELVDYLNNSIFNASIKETTLNKINKIVDDSQNFQDDSGRALPLHYFQTEKLFALMLSSPEFQRR